MLKLISVKIKWITHIVYIIHVLLLIVVVVVLSIFLNLLKNKSYKIK